MKMKWETIAEGCLWCANFERGGGTHAIFMRKRTPWSDDDNFVVDAYDKGLYNGGNCLLFATCRSTPEGIECVRWHRYREDNEGRERVKWTFSRAGEEMPETMEQVGTLMRDETSKHLLRAL